MCFDATATPPAIPDDLMENQSSTSTEELNLRGAEVQFQVFLARAGSPSGPAVLILPDIRGLFEYYKRLAVAFAEAGHHAIAIDYFGRTAGVGDRGDDFDHVAHVKQTTPEGIRADAAVALDHLRSRTGTDDVVSIGFCFGGSQSYLATTDSTLRLSGAIAFYGGLDATRLGVYPDPASKAPEMKGPILALYGGADPSIPPELVQNFDRALDEAGVEHEFVTYPGAPHSFFDRKQGEFTEACDDAWARVLGFLDRIG